MNSASVSSKNERVPPRVENGIAHLDCSLADQHVYIAHFKADTCAKFSACARCRSSSCWHRCYPLLDCNRRERTRARSEAFDSPESVHRACADLKLFNQEVLRVLLLRSKRSRFITLVHAATKSCTNFCWASLLP